MSLRPRFHVALLRANNEHANRDPDDGLGNEARQIPYDDDETVRAMVRLFLDVTDAYQMLVATGRQEVCNI
jgi:hypothetical protein